MKCLYLAGKQTSIFRYFGMFTPSQSQCVAAVCHWDLGCFTFPSQILFIHIEGVWKNRQASLIFRFSNNSCGFQSCVWFVTTSGVIMLKMKPLLLIEFNNIHLSYLIHYKLLMCEIWKNRVVSFTNKNEAYFEILLIYNPLSKTSKKNIFAHVYTDWFVGEQKMSYQCNIINSPLNTVRNDVFLFVCDPACLLITPQGACFWVVSNSVQKNNTFLFAN